MFGRCRPSNMFRLIRRQILPTGIEIWLYHDEADGLAREIEGAGR